MSGTPFFTFLGHRDPAYAVADLRRMCARGELTPLQAREVIAHLHKKGLFTEPMPDSQRSLLAILTRTGRMGPRLVVDNGPIVRPAQAKGSS